MDDAAEQISSRHANGIVSPRARRYDPVRQKPGGQSAGVKLQVAISHGIVVFHCRKRREGVGVWHRDAS